MSPSDRTFLHHFSAMIAGLAILALCLIGVAVAIYNSTQGPARQTDPDAVATRLAPVGAVYAGDTGRAAMQAAQDAAAKAAAAQVAYGGTTDGKEIYDHLCHSCHTAGVAGAPKLGDKANWAPRIAEGIDTLIKHATDGYTGPDGNVMPAKGGNPALTSEQVANTVKWIVSQSK
ncbi:MAG TPA: c-type cytochrome [Rhodanobacteraceae bacterium]|nr:c-type cytochrome [Rhodanobacteraceae bacterium]